MNSFKTELFKISFEESIGPILPCVTIMHRKTKKHCNFFNLAALCVEVDDMLHLGYSISPEEAIKIIRKSASFFILNGK